MKSILVFSRYFVERWSNQDYVDVIANFCNTRVKWTDPNNRFFYVITEPREVSSEGERAVFAKFAKIRVALQTQFWDEDKWKMKTETIPQPQAESHSRFLAFEDRLFLFEERRPYITKAMVARILPILYATAAESGIRTLRLEFFKDTRLFQEWVQEFERVVKVKFDRLARPNPIDDPILDKIKRHIEETRAKGMAYENKEEGLVAEEGSLIDSAIRLCDEGYGEFQVEAVRGDETGRKSSREFTLTRTFQYDTDEEFVDKAWREKRRFERTRSEQRRRSRE